MPIPLKSKLNEFVPPPITLKDPSVLKRIEEMLFDRIVPAVGSMVAVTSQSEVAEGLVIALRVKVRVIGWLRPSESTTSIEVTAVSGPVPVCVTLKLG